MKVQTGWMVTLPGYAVKGEAGNAGKMRRSFVKLILKYPPEHTVVGNTHQALQTKSRD